MSDSETDFEQVDPIEDLDIGQSTVIKNVEEFCFWGTSAADPFVGSDRQVDDLEITDARFVNEPGNEGILLEIEGQLTRQLPRGAIDFPEPTEPSRPPETSEQPEATPFWKRAASFGIGLGISVGVFVLVFNAVNDALASAEPITFSPQPVSSAVPIVVIGVLAFVILSTLIDPPLRGGLR